jgi:beta-1,4-mannosyltransferase
VLGRSPPGLASLSRVTRVVELPPHFHKETGGYIRLLTGALQARGLEVVNDLYLSDCAARAGEIDVVHLHWLEYITALDSGRRLSLVRSLVRSARFVRDMVRLKRKRVGIVWTAHNLAPHEPRHPHIERALNVVTLALSDAVIVHSEYARAKLVAAHRMARRKAVVIPIGNFIGVYPEPDAPPPPKTPDEPFEFLCFGHIRPYKQLPELIRAFRALPEPDVRLVIAGKPVTPDALQALRDAAGDDARVQIDARLIPDESVASLHHHADAAVIAYREVFSSAALVLALSYGLPVVVPAHGAATELVQSPASEMFQPGELTRALQRMHTGDHTARVAAALRSVDGDSWAAVAAATAGVYERTIA